MADNVFGIKFRDIFHPDEVGRKIGTKFGQAFYNSAVAVNNQNIANQKYISENQPTWNMTGLQNAGLNPALAAGGNLTSAPSSPTVDMSGFNSGMSVLGKILNTALNGAFRLGNSAVGVAAKAAAA